MNNKWEFPTIKNSRATQALRPDWLIAYRRRLPITPGLGATHFFLDDFRFEAIWNNLEGSLKHLKTEIVFSPDFSVYRDWPLALQIWNTYRNRWCGAFWQEKGYQVIPTVSWAGVESYEFCFAGIEPGGIVAIGTVGVLSDDASRSHFHAGFVEMIQRLSPATILCYGPVPDSVSLKATVSEFAEIINYPTFWKKKGK